jgi:ribose 5-phosphate isomerase A
LGIRWALPVEVLPFARRTEEDNLRSLGATPKLRIDGKEQPVLTDQNNVIYDAAFGTISDPGKLAMKLNDRAGIMAHGLFIGLAHEVIVAGADGLRRMEKKR